MSIGDAVSLPGQPMRDAITVEPVAGPNGFSVDDPEIDEVMDRRTGDHHRVIKYLQRPYPEVVGIRRTLTLARSEGGSPPLVCSFCQSPVFLRAAPNGKRFSFAHFYEDGNCPATTRGKTTIEEMDARKYHGAKESDAHRDTKRFVLESLQADPRFRDVVPEAVVKNLTRWRKPDVQAKLGELEIFFEAQLSTTHLPVILARQSFYRQRGSLLVWIFRSFRKEESLMTQDDIFYFTRNLFVVSEATVEASRSAGAFMLDCHWARPVMRDGELVAVWDSARVSFHELQHDRARGCVYHFDYEGAVRYLEREAAQGETDRVELIKSDFEAWWWRQQSHQPIKESDAPWQALKTLLQARGIPVSRYFGGDGLHEVLRLLYSVKAGRPHGTLKKWIESIHRFESYRSRVRLLRVALVFYERREQLRREDASGAYERKSKETKAKLDVGDAAYDHDPKHDELIRLLFPGLLESHPNWLKAKPGGISV